MKKFRIQTKSFGLVGVIVLFAFGFLSQTNAQADINTQPVIQPPAERYGDIDLSRPDIQIPKTVNPLFDFWIRDTFVKLGHDGYYYMTGTVKLPGKESARYGSPGIPLWRSKDLQNWENLGIVFDINTTEFWQSRASEPVITSWASEIHYIKSQKTYFIVSCGPFKPLKGSFILRSTSGEAIGPYVNIKDNSDGPIFPQIDGSLFEDDDGTVYFVGHSHKIARMKDDMSGFAEPLKIIKEVPYEREPYIEGAYMVKHGGKYHLIHAIWSFKVNEQRAAYDEEKVGRAFKTREERDNARHSYDVVIASADSPYGPFSKRYTAIIGAGHNNLFKDKEGNWWSTMFGNPRKSLYVDRFEAKPAIIPLRYVDGKFYPDFVKELGK